MARLRIYNNTSERTAAWQKANTDNFSMNIKRTDKINKPLLFEAAKAMGPGMSVSKILLEGARMYIAARLGDEWIEERGGPND